MCEHKDRRQTDVIRYTGFLLCRTIIAFTVCIGGLSTVDRVAFAQRETETAVSESSAVQTPPTPPATPPAPAVQPTQTRELAKPVADQVPTPAAVQAEKQAEEQIEDNKPEPVAPPHVPARIDFKQPVHDFGTVEQGEKVMHLFRFTNQGGKDLRITSLKTSCGCTAAIVSEKVIPSGGEGTISATFDTSRFIGEKKKTIGVHTNDPNQAVTTLTLQGEVRVEVAAEPPQLYVGRLQRGKQVTRAVEVLSDAGSGITITKVENNHPSIRVQTEPLERDGKQGKKLLVTVAKDAALGRLNDQITVTTTSTKRPSIIVPVFGSLEGDLLVQPPQVTFGVVQPGESKARKVNIKNQSKKSVKITAVKSTAQGIEAAVAAVTPGVEYNVSLTVSGDAAPGRISGEITVSTDHPEESVLSIPLYGRVADPQQAKR